MLLGLLLTLATAVGSAWAHDFWIIPDAFQIATGDALSVRTIVGTRFPASEAALAPARIAQARVLGSHASDDRPLGDFVVSGKSLVVRHRPEGAGERVVAIALQPSERGMNAEGFIRYLRLEGAGDIVERLSHAGTLPADSVTLRTTKFAKTVVAVGSGGAPAFTRTAGHALELVPRSDPLATRSGDTLHVRVLADGRPLAGAMVHIGRAAAPREASVPESTVRTDGEGIAHIPIAAGGLWNARVAHVERATAGAKPELWNVWWATLVFATADAPRAAALDTASAVNDSAHVVSVVERFHAALARGDSAAALALLAPDVVILESGEVQTRAEYRAHHLGADIAFARALPARRAGQGVRVEGNAAWVSTTTVTEGTYAGRAINSAGAELMVLSREAPGGDWRIRAIHWSSRRRPGGA